MLNDVQIDLPAALRKIQLAAFTLPYGAMKI